MLKILNKKILLSILLVCGYHQISFASKVIRIPEIVITTTTTNTWSTKKMNQYDKKYKKNIPLIFNAYEYTLGGAIGIFYEVTNNMYLGIEYKQLYRSSNLCNEYYYYYYDNEYIPRSNGFGIISISIKF